MKKLKQRVEEQQAIIRPAEPASIDALQNDLGFPLSEEYREYLSLFGIIAHDAYETYGLGVPDDYYLHTLNAYKDLASDVSFPTNAVPLLELGDGQYYLYSNQTRQVILWATPNGGVVKVLDESLEQFLIQHVFSS